MSAIDLKRVVLALSVLVLFQPGCENCPDRSVEVSATPGEVERNVSTTIKVQFSQDVFLEGSPGREGDIRIFLSGPVVEGALLTSVASWDGTTSAPDIETIQSVSVLDARTMSFAANIDSAKPAGTYRLEVIADLAGACYGPSGMVELAVR